MKKLSLDELGRKTIEEYKLAPKLPIIIVLDNIRSLNNIGSFFRTADAFAVESIYLCGITACPPHRDIHKTALGATDSVSWEYFENVEDAIHRLRMKQYEIVSVEQTNKSELLQNYEPKQKTALVFGNEVEGISDVVISVCDKAIEIPQIGTKHSLNVSVCGGIVLWHCFNCLSLKVEV